MSSVVDAKKYLAQELTVDKLLTNRITLVIGYAAKLVKQMMRGSYYTITNVEETREFVAKFSVPLDKLVVVEDLSRIGVKGQAVLLKFLEESYCPILLLASEDCILDTIISRCKVIIKVPVDNSYKSESLGDFIKNRESDFDFSNIHVLEEESMKYCPEYFYLCKNLLETKGAGSFNKYIKLL